jgi:hypothetical protein
MVAATKVRVVGRHKVKRQPTPEEFRLTILLYMETDRESHPTGVAD